MRIGWTRMLACSLAVVVVTGAAVAGAAPMGRAAGDAPPPPAPVDIVLRATGTGRPPANAAGAQARLMAERAAVLVALRNLAVKLGRSQTDVRTGTVKVEAFLAGHRLADRRYEYNDDGSLKAVEATVEISLGRLYGNVHRMLQTQLADAKTKHAETQRDLDRTCGELSDAKRELKQARGSLEVAQRKVAALTADLARAQQRLADSQTRRAALEAQNADREAQITTLEARLRALEKESAELRAELTRLRDR